MLVPRLFEIYVLILQIFLVETDRKEDLVRGPNTMLYSVSRVVSVQLYVWTILYTLYSTFQIIVGPAVSGLLSPVICRLALTLDSCDDD